jgi:hypothetical protein
MQIYWSLNQDFVFGRHKHTFFLCYVLLTAKRRFIMEACIALVTFTQPKYIERAKALDYFPA